MILSISNIGWEAANDAVVYKMMSEIGFQGLEIAPTRIFSENPYDKIQDAVEWSNHLQRKYGFWIPSMQSIWYGRQEKIFGTEKERKVLVDYTKKAIDFASAIKCKNLVFGCPKNRNILGEYKSDVAVEFFKEIGDYAMSKATTIGMEANPSIYNTNFVNDTLSALELIEQVDSDGFRLNLDIGTMIENDEDISELVGKVKLINHVHISEPWLKPIQNRQIHFELKNLLENENYQGYISIEMGKLEDISILEDRMRYVKEVFR